jgi:hypothetical protein
MSAAGRVAGRFAPALLTVALAGLLVRGLYVLLVAPDTLGFDAIWYHLQSETLAEGHGYVDPDLFYRAGRAVPTANFPPLWPLVLAAASTVGLDGQQAHQLVGAGIGSITIVVTGLVGRRVGGARVGLVAAAFVAASPLLIAADGSLMAESLYVLLVTTAVLVAYVCIARRSWSWFLVLGLVLGAAALARSDALIVAPLLVASTAWCIPLPITRRIVSGVIAAAAVVAVLVPWVVRNERQMGEPLALSSNSGSVLEGANCATTYSGRLLGAWDGDCLVLTRQPDQDELEWSAAARQAGIDYARDHPARLPLVGTARVLRAWSLWSPIDQAELETIETRVRDWQIAGGVVAIVMLGLAVPGTRRLLRGDATLAPMVAVVIGVSVAALAANGNTRFTLAALPIVSVAAAAFVVRQPSSEPTTETNETISPG